MSDFPPTSSLRTARLSLAELRGRRVTVMGLGSFGGGAGAVEFLVRQGARVTLTDLRSEEVLAPQLAALGECQPERLHLGGHREADFTETELLVINPAVPRDNAFVQLATVAGVPQTSEMNLFWQFNRSRVIGVTGSNGKSTTTAMTHALLAATGNRCWLGGNIGGSLLPRVGEIGGEDWVILELSSFQLDDLDALQASPQIAVVTNFSPNHLDRHGTLDEYRRAKQTILRWQCSDDWAVLNDDDADVRDWPTAGRRVHFGLSVPEVPRDGIFDSGSSAVFRLGDREQILPLRDWLTLPGRHNLQNALAATAAALLAGASLDAVQSGLRHYKALPHRLELVGVHAGRRFYNDSLATTPESVVVALEAFDAPLVLIAGGYDKGVSLESLVEKACRKPIKAAALIGQTASALAAAFEKYDPQRTILRQECTTFDEAFAWSVSVAAPGDVVLLSPGCASYDWFRNFADRGEQFARRVHAL